MGTLILDASVLIALFDLADAHHEQANGDLELADQSGDRLATPASAYAESLVAFARAGKLSAARDALASMGIRIAPLDADVAETSAELRARHRSLTLPDAIVLATAATEGAKLLTYDKRLARLAPR